MIEINQVSKKFNMIQAVNQVTLSIQEGKIFGLLGTNGAGKSTLLRIMAGILKQDEGSIKIDGEDIYDNLETKQRLFYLSDEQYFFPNATLHTMKIFYKSVYSGFDGARLDELAEYFELDKMRKINTFSKGMKKQACILLGICANTKYILCDEVFDGLDPIVRESVKSIVTNEMKRRELVPIIASHNLKELEDICNHIGILHRGGVILSKDLAKMKYNIHKIQCVFEKEEEEFLTQNLSIIKYEKKGFLVTVIARGEEMLILKTVQSRAPLCCQLLPLSLEEIFINETEAIGYDIKKFVF